MEPKEIYAYKNTRITKKYFLLLPDVTLCSARLCLYLHPAAQFFRVPTMWSIDLTVATCHIHYTFLSLCRFFFTTENGQNTKILEVDVSTGAQSINTESESPLFHISSHSKAFFSSSYISPCEKLRLKVTSTCLNRTVPTHKLGPSKYWKAKLAADRMRQFQL